MFQIFVLDGPGMVVVNSFSVGVLVGRTSAFLEFPAEWSLVAAVLTRSTSSLILSWIRDSRCATRGSRCGCLGRFLRNSNYGLLNKKPRKKKFDEKKKFSRKRRFPTWFPTRSLPDYFNVKKPDVGLFC